MTPDYVRDVLIRMPEPDRRGLLLAMRNRVNRDPDEHEPVTRLWFAIYATIVDLEYEATELFRELESGQ